MPSTFFNGIYNPGDWKGVSKQDNTKANYTHKKEKLPLSSLAPSMVARQPNSAVLCSRVSSWSGYSLITGTVKGPSALWDSVHQRLNQAVVSAVVRSSVTVNDSDVLL